MNSFIQGGQISMFKNGEWVIYNGDRIKNALGYVEESNDETSLVTLILNGRNDTKIYRQLQAMNTDLTLAPINSTYFNEENQFLVNLALDTNDKEWFQELSKRFLVQS